MMDPRGKCASRSATTPTQPCSSDFYRCLKGRLGRSLRISHGKKDLVSARNKLLIHYLELKVVFLALKEFQDLCSDHSYYCYYIASKNKAGGMSTVFPSTENIDLLLQEAGDSQGPTHSRADKCDSQPAI